MQPLCSLTLFLLLSAFLSGSAMADEEVFLRVNQVGYLIKDKKEAILFSNRVQ